MRLIGFLCALAWCLLSPQAQASDITLVVGFAAGGTSSTAARAILDPLSRASAKRVIIENKPGAGGLLAAQHVAVQTPESGALLFMSSSSSLRVPLDLGLVPVALVARYDYVVVKRGSAKGLDAYLVEARDHQELQSVATPGAGSTSHLSLARVFREHQVSMLHVPYAGGAPAINAVMGGHVALAAVPYPDFIPFDGVLTIVAKTGEGLGVSGWMGVYAPPGTSPSAVAELSRWLQVAAQESVSSLSKLGFVASFESAEVLAREHATDRQLFLPELEREGVRF